MALVNAPYGCVPFAVFSWTLVLGGTNLLLNNSKGSRPFFVHRDTFYFAKQNLSFLEVTNI
jgi:hypothetical protein